MFSLSLLISAIDIKTANKDKQKNNYYRINYILPVIGILLTLNTKIIYLDIINTPILIFFMLLIALYSLLQMAESNSIKIYYLFTFIGMIFTSINSLDDFFNVKNFFYFSLIGNIFIIISIIKLLLEFKKQSNIEHKNNCEIVSDLKEDFEYSVKKAAAERTFYMERQKESIRQKSRTDNLTKINNRTGLMYEFDSMLIKDEPFSILILDIDFFKTINDTLGHIVGDKCIKELALIAKTSIRSTDIIGRYGGDEFVIILPHTDSKTALKVGENLRSRVAKTKDPHYTVSIGVGCYPEDGQTFESLLNFADESLYLSKKKGKNAVSYKRNE